MKTLEDMLKDYLDVETWGKALKNPISGESQPITGDRVKKLLPRIDQKYWTLLGGKYYILKTAPDPRERNSDGSIHWGRTKK